MRSFAGPLLVATAVATLAICDAATTAASSTTSTTARPLARAADAVVAVPVVALPAKASHRLVRVSRKARPPARRHDAAHALPATTRVRIPVPASSNTGVRPPRNQGTGTSWTRPTEGFFIQPFRGAAHEGVDIGGEAGQPIYSVGDGVVVGAGPMGGYGIYVAVQHGGADVSLYAHLSAFSVEVGQHVSAGEQIASMGMTGDANGTVHLHFEIHQGGLNWNYIDPEPWLSARGVSLR